MIADYRGEIGDPAALAARLEADPGVAAHGLFPPDMVSEVLVGAGGTVEPLDPELTTEETQMTDFTGLAIAGRVATPSDPDWDEARPAWNLAADQRPEAVAFVESADDVATDVRFAAENDLKVAGQGTGHGAVAPRPARSRARSCSRPSACAGSRSTPRRRPRGSRPASSSPS